MTTAHVIGSGISGLAAATALAADHIPVKLYEATTAAGGRCRSSGSELGTIDHGLHLIHGSDAETFAFLDRVGAREQLIPVEPPRFPRASVSDYAALALTLLLPADRKLADSIAQENPLYDEWATNFSRLRLHTPPHEVSARAVRDAMRHGPLHAAKASLAESFIAPALTFLEYCGGSVYFSHALVGMAKTAEAITTLNFARKKVSLHANDVVILAVPPNLTLAFFPDIPLPPSSHSAITLHYAAEHGQMNGSVRFVHDGIVDLIRFDAGMVRVSMRVADGAWHSDQPLLAARIWRHVQKLHRPLRGQSLGKWTIWREKYAGHRMDVASVNRAPTPIQPHPRCILAGDWLDPARPASIESAAAAGHRAAEIARELLGKRPFHHQ